MSLLNDVDITNLCLDFKDNLPVFKKVSMITPFVTSSDDKYFEYDGDTIKMFPKKNTISFGVSSFGYDARLAPEYKVFVPLEPVSVDPKNFDERCYVTREADLNGRIVIPPNSFILGRTVEYFKIPDDVFVECLGKSTYARCGIFVNVTPLEPGWEGHVTLEFSNNTPLPAILYANEGCCQFIFTRGRRPRVTYKDRSGKYMYQKGITLAKL